MSRKTNLFFTTGTDSNFLTFSNFTEALTRCFLSTDWKVYPSRFLCLYIPSLLDESKKENFIKNYLVEYYENKLAYLRDVCSIETLNVTDENNLDIEGDINSLAWLINTINIYTTNEESNYEITFVGDVTEFDYKGTYTDTICIIDASDGVYEDTNDESKWKVLKYDAEIEQNENDVQRYIKIKSLLNHSEDDPEYGVADKEPTDVLYGWTSEELEATPYVNSEVKLDNEDSYNIKTQCVFDKVQGTDNILKFNVIIPLFDIMPMGTSNYDTLDTTIEPWQMLNRDINAEVNDKAYQSINNPMGIWFADEVIELKRDKESKYAPSWSLTISSQFKPFPYSNNYINNDNDDISNGIFGQAFQTYAQILSEKNKVDNVNNSLIAEIASLKQIITRLNNLDNNEKLEKVLQLERLTDDLNSKLDSIDSYIDTKVAEKVNEMLYKWKGE